MTRNGLTSGRTLPSVLGLALVGLMTAACGSNTLTEPDVGMVAVEGLAFSHLDPDTKDACKNGGWEALGFRNQGQCVRCVETGKDCPEHEDPGEPDEPDDPPIFF